MLFSGIVASKEKFEATNYDNQGSLAHRTVPSSNFQASSDHIVGQSVIQFIQETTSRCLQRLAEMAYLNRNQCLKPHQLCKCASADQSCSSMAVNR